MPNDTDRYPGHRDDLAGDGSVEDILLPDKLPPTREEYDTLLRAVVVAAIAAGQGLREVVNLPAAPALRTCRTYRAPLLLGA